MQYGNTKTTYPIDESGSTITTIDTYWRDQLTKAIKQYRIRVKVYNHEEELAEYIRFTDDIAKHRCEGTLTCDKEDMTTKPSFVIDYPKDNIDNSWFIIKSYCVITRVH